MEWYGLHTCRCAIKEIMVPLDALDHLPKKHKKKEGLTLFFTTTD